MAHQHYITCDGCDNAEIVPDGGNAPSIINVLVSIKAGPDKGYDLCPRCYERLIRDADPRQWCRPAKVAAA